MNIFCHICDEELADKIDNLPDKCPICDTRKYEIIQEIKSLEEEEKTPQSQPTVSPVIEKSSTTTCCARRNCITRCTCDEGGSFSK